MGILAFCSRLTSRRGTAHRRSTRSEACQQIEREFNMAVSINWDKQGWDLARAAYLADLDTDPHSPNVFRDWVQQALDRHTSRSPAERLELAETITDTPASGDRIIRSFYLRPSTAEPFERAIVDDRVQTGRMVSRSGFIREAILLAVADTKQRLDGRQLPQPPNRLPIRPPRRDI